MRFKTIKELEIGCGGETEFYHGLTKEEKTWWKCGEFMTKKKVYCDDCEAKLEQTKAIKKMIVDKIDSLREEEQKYYDKKLKAFEEHSQFEGMYLGLAKETRKIIEVLEELLSKIEGRKSDGGRNE